MECFIYREQPEMERLVFISVILKFNVINLLIIRIFQEYARLVIYIMLIFMFVCIINREHPEVEGLVNILYKLRYTNVINLLLESCRN